MLDYVAGVHPRFNRTKAEGFLARTTIKRRSKVRELSKGMVAQLHLALVMAIDAKLLVLDEPTLGLDILYRKQIYDSLLNDYFDRELLGGWPARRVGCRGRCCWVEHLADGDLADVVVQLLGVDVSRYQHGLGEGQFDDVVGV